MAKEFKPISNVREHLAQRAMLHRTADKKEAISAEALANARNALQKIVDSLPGARQLSETEWQDGLNEIVRAKHRTITRAKNQLFQQGISTIETLANTPLDKIIGDSYDLGNQPRILVYAMRKVARAELGLSVTS